MKKFLIFFILLVSLMTFVLTRPKGTTTTNNTVVSNEEIENYRQNLINSGLFHSEETIDTAINEYIELQTKAKQSKKQGMPFKEALKISFISSVAILGILFLIYQLKNAQYNEFFGSHMGDTTDNKNYPLKGFMRFFFGRWF